MKKSASPAPPVTRAWGTAGTAMTTVNIPARYAGCLKSGLALLLCLLLALPQYPAPVNQNKYTPPFNWAVKNYLDGHYRETLQKLTLLLTFLDDAPDSAELKINTLLLMGAACEKMGRIVEARRYYKSARENADNRKVALKRINIDELVEYQRVIMDNTVPLMERVVEIESRRPKPKRASVTLVLAGFLVVLGIAIFFTLANDNDRNTPNFNIPESNYDTHVLGISWVKIPAGEFRMGSDDPDSSPDERPVHKVYLDEFRISRQEIKYGQYLAFCNENNLLPPNQNYLSGNGHAVINVSHSMARFFCQWLSKKTGKNIHLPTEAQWEKAARGVDGRRYPWGDAAPDCSFVNFCCPDAGLSLRSYPENASPYGVLDMAGNLAEWCADSYDENYYSFSPAINPQGPAIDTPYRVIRGGSWICYGSVRAADRDRRNSVLASGYDDTIFLDVGFRIVMEN